LADKIEASRRGEQRHEIKDIRLYAIVVASIRHSRFGQNETTYRARGVA
jgi:hypothetical protein